MVFADMIRKIIEPIVGSYKLMLNKLFYLSGDYPIE